MDYSFLNPVKYTEHRTVTKKLNRAVRKNNPPEPTRVVRISVTDPDATEVGEVAAAAVEDNINTAACGGESRILSSPKSVLHYRTQSGEEAEPVQEQPEPEVSKPAKEEVRECQGETGEFALLNEFFNFEPPASTLFDEATMGTFSDRLSAEDFMSGVFVD